MIAALPFLVSYGSSAKKVEENGDPAVKAYNAGVAAQKKKNYEVAINNYEQAVALKPDFVDAFNNMGFCYRMIAKSYLDRSGDAYAKALKINPKHEQALEYQGEYWIMRGELTRAYKNYQTLVQMKSAEAKDLQKPLDEVLGEAKTVLKTYRE